MQPLHTTDPSLIWPDDPSFRNFPKRLPEDCVEYTIHLVDSLSNTTALRSRLLQIQRDAEKLQKDLLKGYIWQREGFGLALSGGSRSPGDDGANGANEDQGRIEPPSGDSKNGVDHQDERAGDQEQEQGQDILHLHGRTSFGDSIADEWVIVHLLRALSTQHADAWIRVWDTDGQFLLIEAAGAIPDWLEPEVAENRIWLHAGRVKIISATTKGKKRRGMVLSLKDALEYLSTAKPNSLLDSNSINAEAFSRIQSHPSSIPSNLHTTTTRITRKLAYLLHRQPQWVSPAIEAFYLRDPFATRTLNGKGDLVLPPEDFVHVPVKLQRVGFAQLRGQEYEVPKAWAGYKSATPSTSLDPSETGDALTDIQRRDIGMKLTCGFEMLLADPANKDKRVVQEIQLILADLEAGDETLPSDAEVRQWRVENKEDSEEWLNIDWEAFERELKGQAGSKDNTATSGANGTAANRGVGEKADVTIDEGFGDKEAQENLRRMVARFEGFLKSEEETGSGTGEKRSDSKARDMTNDVNENDDHHDDNNDDDEDDDDDDASYAPSSSADSSSCGSSEEEGWSPSDSDPDADADSDANAELNQQTHGTNIPAATGDGAEEEEQDLNDTDLKSIIAEMQSMGLKAPPAAGTAQENQELKEALMALADVPIAGTKTKQKTNDKTPRPRAATLGDNDVPASEMNEKRPGKGKGKARSRAATLGKSEEVSDTREEGRGKGKAPSRPRAATLGEDQSNASLPITTDRAPAQSTKTTPSETSQPDLTMPLSASPSAKTKGNETEKAQQPFPRFGRPMGTSRPFQRVPVQEAGGNDGDDDDNEIETIERDGVDHERYDVANDMDSLSSDSETDHLDPADVKSFEEVFGRELREAGVLK